MQEPESTTEGSTLPQAFTPVTSSNLAGIAWFGPAKEDLLKNLPDHHMAQGTLGVIFKNGTRYHYEGVPREAITALLEAESIGKVFNQTVKGNEAYHGSKVDLATGEPIVKTEES